MKSKQCAVMDAHCSTMMFASSTQAIGRRTPKPCTISSCAKACRLLLLLLLLLPINPVGVSNNSQNFDWQDHLRDLCRPCIKAAMPSKCCLHFNLKNASAMHSILKNGRGQLPATMPSLADIARSRTHANAKLSITSHPDAIIMNFVYAIQSPYTYDLKNHEQPPESARSTLQS